MLTYDLKSSNTPLYISLYEAIRNDIANGILNSGVKLPSKRVMALNNGVSVITVENAYELLLSEGYIYSKPKSGYYVSTFSFERRESRVKSESHEEKKEQRGEKDLIDLSSNLTPSDLFPFESWLKAAKSVFSSSKEKLMDNPPSEGIRELRESISGYLEDYRGLKVDPDDIIIGAGSEYLYQLLILLLGRDKRYGIEDPGYPKVGKIYSINGVPLSYLPLDKSGICPEELRKKDIEIVHITPSHQYPKGIIMPITRRLELLTWAAEKDGRYIVEDDYDSVLRLEGKPVPALKSIDTEGRVIYLNTFSRTLCSTARIGYMVLPQSLMEKYRRELSFLSSTVSTFEQYTLNKFMSLSKFESHIARMRTYYRKKRDLFINEVRKSELGTKATISGEKAGLHFLMKIESEKDETDNLSKAFSLGLKLTPLSSFYHNGASIPGEESNTYIINYAAFDRDGIKRIVDKLSRVFL